MSTTTPAVLTFGATPSELAGAVLDFGRQPVVLTLGRDDSGVLNLTLGTTAPESRGNLERMGNLLTTIGNTLTAEARTFIPDADEEADQ